MNNVKNNKVCNKCKITKSVLLFSKDGNKKDGLCCRCKSCKLKYYYENKEKRTDYCKNYDYKKNYNITLEEVNKLFILQNNLCAICNKPESVKFNKDNKIKSLAVDHCHKTGKIRGLLCNRCNSCIGYAKDSYEILISAANYVKKHQT